MAIYPAKVLVRPRYIVTHSNTNMMRFALLVGTASKDSKHDLGSQLMSGENLSYILI